VGGVGEGSGRWNFFSDRKMFAHRKINITENSPEI